MANQLQGLLLYLSATVVIRIRGINIYIKILFPTPVFIIIIIGIFIRTYDNKTSDKRQRIKQ